MSEASEKEATVAEHIIKQLVGNKEDAADNATYRQHIRALIEADFFYLVLTADGCSVSMTGNGKDADAWRAFALAWHSKVLAARITSNGEEKYEANPQSGTDGYG